MPPPTLPLSLQSPMTVGASMTNELNMPLIGFGCAGHVRRDSLVAAIAAGYRLFDTAQAEEWYLEAELGEAIRMSGANRSGLFITSKERARACIPWCIARHDCVQTKSACPS